MLGTAYLPSANSLSGEVYCPGILRSALDNIGLHLYISTPCLDDFINDVYHQDNRTRRIIEQSDLFGLGVL